MPHTARSVPYVFLTLLSTLLFSAAIAQHSKSVMLSTLTNDDSRQWQLDTLIKSFGGCIDKTLILVLNKDASAEFRYCHKGNIQRKKTTWKLEETPIRNLWNLTFAEPVRIKRGDDSLVFDNSRLYLKSKDKNKRGIKFFLVVKIPHGDAIEIEEKVFFARD